MAQTTEARPMAALKDEYLIKEREVDYSLEEFLRAAGDGDLTVLRKHLANGVTNVDGTGWNGYTALILAADCGNPEVVKELLNAGASLHITWCDKKDTALWYATRNKDGKPSQPQDTDEHKSRRKETYELLNAATEQQALATPPTTVELVVV